MKDSEYKELREGESDQTSRHIMTEEPIILPNWPHYHTYK